MTMLVVDDLSTMRRIHPLDGVGHYPAERRATDAFQRLRTGTSAHVDLRF